MLFGNLRERRCFVLLGGRGIERGPRVDDALQTRDVVEIDIRAGDLEIEVVAVAEHLALAGLRQNDELVRQVSADRSGIRDHGDGLEAEARERAQVGDEHLVVGVPRPVLVDVERIGILHQELAAAHQAEARPYLVPEFPLDVVEIERQVLVGAHIGAEDLGDHFLVGRTVQHVALVAVLDAQHLLAIVLVAPALAPQVGRLDCGHQQLDRAGAVLFLADDLLDLAEHPQPQRQEGIDAGCLLPHHSGAQHQAMGNDLGLLGRLAQDR